MLEAGHPVIVTNTSFRMAPWADVLFGFDAKWWREHIEEARRIFKGRMMCGSPLAANLKIEVLHQVKWFRQYGNSGACAVSLAVSSRAKRIVLLGYDCAKGSEPGKAWHWHGDHPKGFSNCASISRWPYHFEKVSQWAKTEGAQVINASRHSALTCFERQELSDAL